MTFVYNISDKLIKTVIQKFFHWVVFLFSKYFFISFFIPWVPIISNFSGILLYVYGLMVYTFWPCVHLWCYSYGSDCFLCIFFCVVHTYNACRYVKRCKSQNVLVLEIGSIAFIVFQIIDSDNYYLEKLIPFPIYRLTDFSSWGWRHTGISQKQNLKKILLSNQ